MKLTYLYHSGFAIEADDFTMIIDYYKDPDHIVRDHLLKRDVRLYVLSSHSHGDHFNPRVFEWQKEKEDITYIFSKDIRILKQTPKTNISFLDKNDTYKDEHIFVKAFGSTDLGISFLIETGGKKIFHGGDLNNWHWNEEVDEAEAKQYEDNYLKELNDLTKETSQIDLVMFPVDPRLGREYMLGAKQFLDAIQVSLFVPMHFGNEYEKAAAFYEYAKSKNCGFMKIEKTAQTIEF